MSRFACGATQPFTCGSAHGRSGAYNATSAWWSSQVCFSRAEEVSEKEFSAETNASGNQRYFQFSGQAGDIYVKTSWVPLCAPPYDFLGKEAKRPITAFTEVRQPYWLGQPQSWITYHAFTLVEVDNGEFYFVLERKTDLLEIVLGEGGLPRMCMRAFRAMGPGRNLSKCIDQPRTQLDNGPTVHQFLGWLDGPVEETWKPYDLFSANCQHFAQELQAFLLNPSQPMRTRPLQVTSLRTKEDRQVALNAITKNWRQLKYATLECRKDREVVLAAIEQDGNALRYADESLRRDKLVCLAAVQRSGYAFPYVDDELREDPDIVLAAVTQYGHMLCYVPEEFRRDKRVCIAALQSDGYALRYVHPDIRYDPAIIMTAAWSAPLSVGRLALG